MAKEMEKTVNAKAEETVSIEDYKRLLDRLDRLEDGKAAEDNGRAERKKKRAEAMAELDKKVKIELFKDGDKYKDDVFVSINGKPIQIKRGVEVEIPKAYADVLKQSQQQVIKTAELMDEESRKFNG